MKPMGAVTALVALALVVATVPAGGLAQTSTPSDADVAPGERLAGVVGVQGAEVDAAVEERTFAHRIQRADSNASKAAIVADRLNQTRERLDELEQRKETLREARANGSISQGQYRARMAQVAAQIRTVERSLNTTAETSDQLPEETLRANGVNVTAIEQLRNRASNMTGPEVAAIARGIAGANAGGSPAAAPGRADERGPPSDRGSGNAAGDGRPDRAGGSNRSDGASTNGSGSDTGSDRGDSGSAADQSGSGSAAGADGSSGGDDTSDGSQTGADGQSGSSTTTADGQSDSSNTTADGQSDNSTSTADGSSSTETSP